MDLSAAFPPAFAAFGRTVLPPRPGTVPLPALLESLGGTPRPHLSLWSQRYLLALVPPVLAAALHTTRAPRLALATAAARPAPDGMPGTVHLPALDRHGRADLPGDLLDHHLAPLATRLAAAGLPAPVFWSNAGYVLSWTLRTLETDDGGGGASSLLTLLQSPFWAGRPNPLPPAPRAALHTGARAVCCLRFHLPATPRCPDCPLLCRGRVAAVDPA